MCVVGVASNIVDTIVDILESNEEKTKRMKERENTRPTRTVNNLDVAHEHDVCVCWCVPMCFLSELSFYTSHYHYAFQCVWLNDSSSKTHEFFMRA